jgi:hypothetical protein
VWSSRVDGQELTFYLVGINNQNFIMADHQTGSWWQQVTGEAIQGPLAGKRLELMPWDEVSFQIWRQEYPQTTVLDSTPEFESRYGFDGNGNREGFAFTVDEDPDDELERGDLIVGLQLPEGDKAYPMALVQEMGPISDQIGGRAVLVVAAPDGRSIRAFDREIDGQALDLYLQAAGAPGVAAAQVGDDSFLLVDAATGSQWNFAGEAISGPMAGRKLQRLQTLKDFWFDWKTYHPDAPVYSAGQLTATSVSR